MVEVARSAPSHATEFAADRLRETSHGRGDVVHMDRYAPNSGTRSSAALRLSIRQIRRAVSTVAVPARGSTRRTPPPARSASIPYGRAARSRWPRSVDRSVARRTAPPRLGDTEDLARSRVQPRVPLPGGTTHATFRAIGGRSRLPPCRPHIAPIAPASTIARNLAHHVNEPRSRPQIVAVGHEPCRRIGPQAPSFRAARATRSLPRPDRS